MDNTSKSIISGTIYTALGKYSSIVIQLIVTAILARFIAPEDFGVMAVCSVFINLFYLLGDLGVGPAIIQRKDITKCDLNEYFTFSFYFGLTLAVIFLLLAPVISHFYDNELLIKVLSILSLQIFFATFNMVPGALLMKNKEFKFVAIRTIVIQFSLGVISCIAAIRGAGIYALLINPIIGSSSIFLLNYFHLERLHFTKKVHRSSLNKIFNYSVFQFLFCLQNYIYRNIDKLIIGKYLTMEQLGYYEKSYRLMLMPVQNISSVVTPVLQPVLSNYQDNVNTQKLYFTKITKLLAVIGFPISVFLFFCAREIILIVFGNQWVEAIMPFKILALSVAPQMLGSVLGSIYLSTNNVKPQLYIGLINTVWSVSMILFGLLYFRTTVGVATMFTIALLVELIYNWTYVYSRIYKVKLYHFYLLLARPILIALLLGASLYIEDMLVGDINILLSLLLKIFISIILVVASLHLLKVYDVKLLFNTITKKWGRNF